MEIFPVIISDVTNLLAQAGKGYQTQQAIFETTQKPVILEYTANECCFTSYPKVLARGAQSKSIGKWLDIESGELCTPDAPYPHVSKIVISRGFTYKPVIDVFTTYSPSLSFVYIVQGMTGTKAKVVLAENVIAAGTGMMHEAMNGYSVVFSAAIEKNVASLIEKSSSSWFALEFFRVSSWEEILTGSDFALRQLLGGGVLNIPLCF
ncbi:hypothetical protein MMC10_002803 [Thelotrema lepadinum]|nr:hypothetical protein [Thelotrema lepadinum]